MLKTQIERILDAEREARERVSAAEAQARVLVDEARAARARIIDDAKAKARAEAESLLQQTADASAAEKAGLLAEAETQANAILAAAASIGRNLARKAARTVAGLD